MSLYFWCATYADGTRVTSDDTPYENIDRRDLKRFEIIERKTGTAVINNIIEPSDCLIWRKRTQLKNDGTSEAVHIVCRERGVGKYRIEMFNENDRSIRVCNRWDPNRAILIEPERLPFEI